MPFVARLPGVIAPGSVSTGLVSNVDFAPTFLDFAGAKAPGSMQGESFAGEMTGARRRYYSITPRGREAYIRMKAEWEEAKTTIEKLLEDKPHGK